MNVLESSEEKRVYCGDTPFTESKLANDLTIVVISVKVSSQIPVYMRKIVSNKVYAPRKSSPLFSHFLL